MQRTCLAVVGMATALLACGDDVDGDDGAYDAAAPDGSKPTAPMDGGGGTLDASKDAAPPLDAIVIDGDAGFAQKVERGRYLTNVIYPCGSCHTPRTAPNNVFAGVDCWSDSLPNDADAGCLSTKNLTNHETGLKSVPDPAVKELFTRGLRPDGKALHPQMPYSLLGNISDTDADAIVTYLRSLPPIDHRPAPNQPPFDVQPAMPAAKWPETQIPLPRKDYAEHDAALRGRYLAGNFGGCMDCHTPRDAKGVPQRERAFQGGRLFGTNAYAPNLTPDATGIEGYTVDDIVRAIKRGEDPDQNFSKLCPPMPSGPMGAYGMMTDGDARDIAHYLLSLTPANNEIPGDCQPVTDAGTPDAGKADGG